MDSNAKTFENTGETKNQPKSPQNTSTCHTVVDIQFDTIKGDAMLNRAEIGVNKKREKAIVIKDSPPYFK